MVPVRDVQGVSCLLDPGQVAEVLGISRRRVIQRLIRPGILRHIVFGGNSIRVRPADLQRFIDAGQTGARHARPSGGQRKGGVA